MISYKKVDIYFFLCTEREIKKITGEQTDALTTLALLLFFCVDFLTITSAPVKKHLTVSINKDQTV